MEGDVMKPTSCYLTSSSSYLYVNTTAKFRWTTTLYGNSRGRLTKHIGKDIVFPGAMLNVKGELLQFKCPSAEFPILILHRLDVFERRMVRVDRDHRRSKVDGEGADGSNLSQRFFLDCGVVEFSCPELAAEVADRMFQSINDLKQYCSQNSYLKHQLPYRKGCHNWVV